MSGCQFRRGIQPYGVSVVAQPLDRGFTSANTESCASLANAGIRTLDFVRPDPRAALHRCLQVTRDLTLSCLLRQDPSAGCEWIEDKLKRASVHDKAAQATGVIVDIELLARADVFVGTFTSALSRVACVSGQRQYSSAMECWC